MSVFARPITAWRDHGVSCRSGDARRRLGEKMAAAAGGMGRDVERARGKALIAPTIICAAVSPQLVRPEVLLEECLAVGAAIQNIMPALHPRGVGSIWTTGALIGSEEVREFFRSYRVE